MALKIIKQEPEFAKGDKVKIRKKYRFLYPKDDPKYDGTLTILEFKEKVRLPPYLVDIVYLEEEPENPHQSQYFEKVLNKT